MDIDNVNAAFEVAGSLVVWLNVRQLLRDRKVAGVHWGVTGFYLFWGIFNLYFYGSLGYWWSFGGQVAMLSGNVAWLALVIKLTYGGS